MMAEYGTLSAGCVSERGSGRLEQIKHELAEWSGSQATTLMSRLLPERTQSTSSGLERWSLLLSGTEGINGPRNTFIMK